MVLMFPLAPPLGFDPVALLSERSAWDAAVTTDEIGILHRRKPSNEFMTEFTDLFDPLRLRREFHVPDSTVDESSFGLRHQHAVFLVHVLPEFGGDLDGQVRRRFVGAEGLESIDGPGRLVVFASQDGQRTSMARDLAVFDEYVEEPLLVPEVERQDESSDESNEIRLVGSRIGVIGATISPKTKRTRDLLDELVLMPDLLDDPHHEPGAGDTTPASPGPLGSAAASTRPLESQRTAWTSPR